MKTGVSMLPIYLDYAATTPLSSECIAAAKPFYKDVFFNPSSQHALGQKASVAVEAAREACAAAINARPSEIYFTSGGTEAINWAIRSISKGKNHIVVSAIEHDAVLSCAELLEANGYEVDYVMPNALGTITEDALNKALRDDTALVCVMAVNNIVGSIQPIKELCAAAHKRGALFFTDAVQAMNGVNVDVKDWGVDMLAVSGHKFYAPKGVGFLYVKDGTNIDSFMLGGGQESGKRAGTVNVPAVVALGVAARSAQSRIKEYNEHIKTVTGEFLSALRCGEIIKCENHADDIICVDLFRVGAATGGGRLVVALSMAGVCCSGGAACAAGSAVPPRTLVEMGVKHPDCCVRFSFGRPTTVTAARNAARIVNRTISRFG